eukprot:4989102-Alexandrium_andersonii.AAC.1
MMPSLRPLSSLSLFPSFCRAPAQLSSVRVPVLALPRSGCAQRSCRAPGPVTRARLFSSAG